MREEHAAVTKEASEVATEVLREAALQEPTQLSLSESDLNCVKSIRAFRRMLKMHYLFRY